MSELVDVLLHGEVTLNGIVHPAGASARVSKAEAEWLVLVGMGELKQVQVIAAPSMIVLPHD